MFILSKKTICDNSNSNDKQVRERSCVQILHSYLSEQKERKTKKSTFTLNNSNMFSALVELAISQNQSEDGLLAFALCAAGLKGCKKAQ